MSSLEAIPKVKTDLYVPLSSPQRSHGGLVANTYHGSFRSDTQHRPGVGITRYPLS